MLPFDAFALVLLRSACQLSPHPQYQHALNPHLLLRDEHVVVEQLLQLLVRKVDAQLLKRVQLAFA